MEFLYATAALLAFLFVILVKGIRIVPQGTEWVIERFGKYRITLKPGLSIIIPFIDSVAYKIVTKDIVLDIDEQEVITKDNAVIKTNAIAFIKIIDPVTCVYGIVDYSIAVMNLVQTALRSIVGEMTLDDALSSREQIKAKLIGMVADDMLGWGINLKAVEIQDIQPSSSMQVAMEQQAAAERERKAMVTRAEGAKQSAILEAEGRLESAKRDAEAEVSLADGSKKALLLIGDSIEKGDMPLHYLLGQRYVDAVKEMATSSNSKFLVLPADIHQSVRGILGDKKPEDK